MPEAVRLITEAAAPSLQGTQANLIWKDGRYSFSTRFLPPPCRRISYEGGTQARSPPWHCQEDEVDLFAVGYGSESRHGAGKNNGGGVGASCRKRERKKGRKKGTCCGEGGGSSSRQEKRKGSGVC